MNPAEAEAAGARYAKALNDAKSIEDVERALAEVLEFIWSIEKGNKVRMVAFVEEQARSARNVIRRAADRVSGVHGEVSS